MGTSWRHRAYQIGIVIKGLDGVIETVGGVLFLAVDSEKFARLTSGLAQRLLASDPDDWIARDLGRSFARFTGATKLFAGAYLLGHGVLKIFIVVSLFRRRPWAYLTAIGALGIFIAYELYRFFAHTHGFTLIALAVFDGAVAALIASEYRRLLRERR
ncbi:MAG: DUF2127 domain-containing protein [Opitutaceae bacterium]